MSGGHLPRRSCRVSRPSGTATSLTAEVTAPGSGFVVFQKQWLLPAGSLIEGDGFHSVVFPLAPSLCHPQMKMQAV